MRAVCILASLPASGVWAEIKDSGTAEKYFSTVASFCDANDSSYEPTISFRCMFRSNMGLVVPGMDSHVTCVIKVKFLVHYTYIPASSSHCMCTFM